jgi:hypothetical protein
MTAVESLGRFLCSARNRRGMRRVIAVSGLATSFFPGSAFEGTRVEFALFQRIRNSYASRSAVETADDLLRGCSSPSAFQMRYGVLTGPAARTPAESSQSPDAPYGARDVGA